MTYFVVFLSCVAAVIGLAVVCWMLLFNASALLIRFSKVVLCALLAYICVVKFKVFSNGWAEWAFFFGIIGILLLILTHLRYTAAAINFMAAYFVSHLVVLLVSVFTVGIIVKFIKNDFQITFLWNLIVSIISLVIAVIFASMQDEANADMVTEKAGILQILLASPIYGITVGLSLELALQHLKDFSYSVRYIFLAIGITSAAALLIQGIILLKARR